MTKTKKPTPPEGFDAWLQGGQVSFSCGTRRSHLTFEEWDYIVKYAKYHGWASDAGLFLDGQAPHDLLPEQP